MASPSLRTMTLEGVVYRWQVRHRHDETESGRACCEVFSAFLPGFRGGPLRVFFRDSPTTGSEYIGRAGVVVDYAPPTRTYNLNRPLLAREIIELAVARGWNARRGTGPFVVENGFEWLAEHVSALPPDHFA